MKITLTGSLGNIGRSLSKELLKKGHTVTIISSKPERKVEIEKIGGIAAIGELEDEAFVNEAFKGADAVFGMVPPSYDKTDMIQTYRTIATNYASAITINNVKRVVALSSFGAHLSEGTGNIMGAHNLEQILEKLNNIELTIMRPTYFFNNFLNYVDMVKHSGAVYANYGGDNKKIPVVSPYDIASAIIEELESSVANTHIRYVVSEELDTEEITEILGDAIGKNIDWHLISDEEMEKGLRERGMPSRLSESITEMFAAMHTGRLAEHFKDNKPKVYGTRKLKDFFANEDFVTAYKKA